MKTTKEVLHKLKLDTPICMIELDAGQFKTTS